MRTFMYEVTVQESTSSILVCQCRPPHISFIRLMRWMADDLSLLFTGKRVPNTQVTETETQLAAPDSDVRGEDPEMNRNGTLIQLDMTSLSPRPQGPHTSQMHGSKDNEGKRQSEGSTLNVEESAHAPPNHQPGFTAEQLGVDRRMLVNRRRQLKMYRVWMQGKFRKVLMEKQDGAVSGREEVG
jgi:tRNAThr (cytosine32-N3)-methyltransferase